MRKYNMPLNITEGFTFNDVLLKPKMSLLKSRSETDISVNLTKDINIKIPFIPANMKNIASFDMVYEIYKLGGMAILHRFMPFEEQLDILNKVKKLDNGINHIGFSIGVKEEDYKNIDIFANNGVKILCIDIAHGHSDACLKMTKYISSKYSHIFLIAGNVATSDGAVALWEAGADAIKAGCGPGSTCLTRIETGNGVPQLTALQEIWDQKEKTEKKLNKKLFSIADGGIKNAGDTVKALCFSDMVMIGNIFAGSDECLSNKIIIDGKEYYEYNGSSTLKSNHKEGVEAIVPAKGPVKNIINNLSEGLKSGLSYQGCYNLADLKKDPQFVRVSSAGEKENGAHDVIVVNKELK